MDLSGKVGRRDLLKRSAIGLAAIGAAAAIPAVVLTMDSDDEDAQANVAPPSDVKGPLVAYVQDAATGDVLVMAGESEFVINDPRLVAKLAGAVGG